MELRRRARLSRLDAVTLLGDSGASGPAVASAMLEASAEAVEVRKVCTSIDCRRGCLGVEAVGPEEDTVGTLALLTKEATSVTSAFGADMKSPRSWMNPEKGAHLLQ